MMFVTSPTLSALALAAIPAIVFPLLAYGRAVRRLSRTAQDRLADASAYAADNLGAVRAMAAFGQEAAVSGRFAARRRARVRGGARPPAGPRRAYGDCHLPRRGQRGRRAVVWLAAGHRRRDDRRAARAVHPLCGVRGRCHGRAGRGVGRAGPSGRRHRTSAGAAGRRNRRSARPQAPRALPEPPLGTVAFKDVHFAYPSRPGVSALNGVSFEVAARRDGGPGRPVGRGQEHDLQSDPALL